MKGRAVLAAAILLIAAGVGGLFWLSWRPSAGPGGLTMSNTMRDFTRASYSSLGQEIFLTGQDTHGRISYSVPGGMMGSAGGMMSGGMMHLSCANCHGADGSGGLTFSNGVVSANLRQLIQGQNPPYNLSLFTRAVTQGIDNQGLTLNPPMPRWNMSGTDVDALWTYVKTLQH